MLDCNKKIQKSVQQHFQTQGSTMTKSNTKFSKSISIDQMDDVDSISFLETQTTIKSQQISKEACIGKGTPSLNYKRFLVPDTLHPASPSFINFDDFEGDSINYKKNKSSKSS